jgi:hypothetical protein
LGGRPFGGGILVVHVESSLSQFAWSLLVEFDRMNAAFIGLPRSKTPVDRTVVRAAGSATCLRKKTSPSRLERRQQRFCLAPAARGVTASASEPASDRPLLPLACSARRGTRIARTHADSAIPRPMHACQQKATVASPSSSFFVFRVQVRRVARAKRNRRSLATTSVATTPVCSAAGVHVGARGTPMQNERRRTEAISDITEATVEKSG